MKKLSLLSIVFSGSLFAQGQQYVVSVPVASIWAVPHEVKGACQYPLIPSWCAAIPRAHHDNALVFKNHDTDVMLHERVIDLGDSPNPDLLHVAIPSQPNGQGNPVDGYINKNNIVACGDRLFGSTMVVQTVAAHVRPLIKADHRAVYFGTVLQHDAPIAINDDLVITLLDGSKGLVNKADVRVIQSVLEPVQALRHAVCDNAKKFLGMPYCWGGRSVFLGADASVVSSVDCSGLISLLMHSVGLVMPRNSASQAAYMTPVEPVKMEPGDVMYLGPVATGYPRHIVLYLGKDEQGRDLVLEATGGFSVDSNVRVTPVEQRFGMSLAQMYNGMKITSAYASREYQLLCGSFFIDAQKLQAMRDNFLANLGHVVAK